MKQSLTRFGVAMESDLLAQFDRIVERRGCTRSEAFRDLARSAVVDAQVEKGVESVASLTLVYDHHVRALTERLTEIQHELGARVISTMHVHLDHDNCLEVIVMRGKSDELRTVADRILATRGVKHGGIEIISRPLDVGRPRRPQEPHEPHPPRPRKPAARLRRTAA